MNILPILAEHESSLRRVARTTKKPDSDFAHQILYRAEQLKEIQDRIDKLVKASILVVDSAKPSPWLDKLQDALTDCGVTPVKRGGMI